MGVKANWNDLRKERDGEEMKIATSVSTFEKFFQILRNTEGARGRNQSTCLCWCEQFISEGEIDEKEYVMQRVVEEEMHGLEGMHPSPGFGRSRHACLII